MAVINNRSNFPLREILNHALISLLRLFLCEKCCFWHQCLCFAQVCIILQLLIVRKERCI